MLTVHQSVTARLELHEFSGMKIQDIEKNIAEGYQYAVFTYGYSATKFGHLFIYPTNVALKSAASNCASV